MSAALRRLLVIALALAWSPLPGLEVPLFTCVPSDDPVTAFALTEDGAFLVMTHRATDSFSVWDAATGTLVRKVTCPAAGCLLSRGDKVFVANQGKGTISIFSQRTWTLDDQVKVDDRTVVSLSAPGGTHFDNQLLVTLGGEDRMLGATHHGDLIDLHTEQSQTVIQFCSLAVFNHRGDEVVIADLNTGVTYEAYLTEIKPHPAASPQPATTQAPVHNMSFDNRIAFLNQAQDSPWWCGGDSFYGENLSTFQPFVVDRSEIQPQTVMDARARTLFAIRQNGINAYDLDTMKPTVSWRVQQVRTQDPNLTDQDWLLMNPPQAVTIDGQVHIYVRGTTPGMVYVAHLDAKGGAVVAAGQGGTPKAAAPKLDTPKAADKHQQDPASPASGVGEIASSAGDGHPAPLGGALSPKSHAAAALVLKGAGAPAVFTMIPTDEPADAFTLNDDGSQLALLHSDSDRISLWDVATETLTRTISCPVPTAIVWRGHKAYIANGGAATINVFDTTAWTQEDQLKAPGTNIIWLAAACGASFDGKLYATLGTGGQDCTYFQIDSAKDAFQQIKTLTPEGIMMVSANGKAALTYEEFFRRDNQQAIFTKAGNVDMLPEMIQCADGPYWASHDGIFMNLPPVAMPLKPVATQENGFMPQVAMDQTGRSFYRICQDHVEAYACKVDLPRLGTWPATLPISETERQGGRYTLPSFPQAATLNGVTHVFICSHLAGGVLTADLVRIPSSP